MESKGTSVALGGAALLAVLLSPFAQRSQPAASLPSSGTPARLAHEPPKATEQRVANAKNLIEDDTGPWHALCKEFARSHDHQDLPTKGIHGPERMDEEPIERTRRFPGYDEKYSIHQHPRRSISSCIPSGAQLRLLIATVPDPEASHLSLDFDRFVEAIQHAAAFHNFVFERYWLPWQPGSGQAVSATESPVSVSHYLKQDQPGLLIFRSTEANRTDERLLVFLVGETPTSGLNKVMFLNALRYTHDLQWVRTAGTDAQVDIAGPTLSGSYPALADALRSKENKVRDLQFNISNPGSASADLIRSFKQRLAQPLTEGVKGNAADPPRRLKYAYSSHDLRSCRAIDVWEKTMASMNYKPAELAVIVEDESAYGAHIDEGGNPAGPAATPLIVSGGSSDSQINSNDSCPTLGTDDVRPERLQFPRDLSSLRNASEAQPQANVPKELQGMNLPQFGVPLTLQDESDERDSPLSFASVQSAARIDRALQAMVRRLRQLRTQAVFITATNPLDVIFLLEYLHNKLPDLRLATFGADEFMLGRPRFVDLSGTLVVSELPLLSDHAVRKERSLYPIDFPSSRAQGMFLALSTLIAENMKRERDGYEDSCASVSVVSKNGFRLLQTTGRRQAFPCTGPAQLASIVPTRGPVPWVWSVALLALGVIGVYHLAWLASCRNQNLRNIVRPPKAYVCLSDSSVCDLKTFFLFILNNQIFLLEWMAVTTTGALFLARAHGVRLYQWFLFGLHAGLLIAMGFASVMLLGFLIYKVTRSKRSPPAISENTACVELASAKAKFNLFVCVVYMLWTIISWWVVLANGWHWHLDSATAIRSVQLFEGLSPLAAMAAILFAYALWAFNNLQRLTMVEARRVGLALPETSSLSVAHNHLLQYIEKSFWEIPTWLAFGFVLTCILFRFSSVLRGIDHLALRTWLVLWGFVMLLFTIFLACHRGWENWRKLKEVLQSLDASAVRGTFSQVPKELSTMQIWKIGGSRVSFLLQHRTLELLRRLQERSVASAKKEQHLVLMAYAMAHTGTSPVTRALVRRVESSVEQMESPTNPVEEAEAALRRIEQKHQKRELPAPDDIKTLSKGLNSRITEAAPFFEPHTSTDEPEAEEQQGLKLYACYRAVSLIRYSMLQLRNLLTFILYGYAALLICMTVYPFQGRQTLGGWMALVFLLLLSGITVLLVQMNRDPILRSCEPDRGGGFGESLALIGKVLGVGGAPLLAVMASQFPAIAEFFLSWMRPAIEAATR